MTEDHRRTLQRLPTILRRADSDTQPKKKHSPPLPLLPAVLPFLCRSHSVIFSSFPSHSLVSSLDAESQISSFASHFLSLFISYWSCATLSTFHGFFLVALIPLRLDLSCLLIPPFILAFNLSSLPSFNPCCSSFLPPWHWESSYIYFPLSQNKINLSSRHFFLFFPSLIPHPL